MIKLPMNFDEFAKDPWKAIQFLLLIVVGYLWLDNKMNYETQIKNQNEKIIVLEDKLDKCMAHWKQSDSALAAANSKIEVLTTLGKIPK